MAYIICEPCVDVKDTACVDFISHGKQPGVQRKHPATEAQKGGLLNFWMMLHFFQENKELALRIFREARGFYSFTGMCETATEWTLTAIRKGKLNAFLQGTNILDGERAFQDQHPLIAATKDLFTGIMYK